MYHSDNIEVSPPIFFNVAIQNIVRYVDGVNRQLFISSPPFFKNPTLCPRVLGK